MAVIMTTWKDSRASAPSARAQSHPWAPPRAARGPVRAVREWTTQYTPALQVNCCSWPIPGPLAVQRGFFLPAELLIYKSFLIPEPTAGRGPVTRAGTHRRAVPGINTNTDHNPRQTPGTSAGRDTAAASRFPAQAKGAR